MNEVLTIPEARPASLGSTSLIAARSTGLKAMPAPMPSRIMLGRTSTTKLPSTGARANHRSPRPGEPETHSQRQPDPVAHDELRGEPDRERSHDQVPRQEGETNLQRAVPEDKLEIEGGEEEPGEHRARPENPDDVRDGEVAELEEAERHEGSTDAGFDGR